MTRRIVVIGAGIVGSAIAAGLADRPDCEVTVLDQAPGVKLIGSTGHAPGFVGLLGDAPVLTELARRSVEIYRDISYHREPGFDRVGGLELATSAAGVRTLERRAEAAAAEELPARLLEPAEAAELAPRLVDPARVLAGLHFPLDGTARAVNITQVLRVRAAVQKVRIMPGLGACGIETRGDRVRAVRAGELEFPADDVVFACGVWGPAVAVQAGIDLPLVPVAHPYVYGPKRDRALPPTPFVRWPEHHVYARDHGLRDGLGSYDHEPRPVSVWPELKKAEMPWPATLFQPAIDAGMRLLKEEWPVARRLNGLFALTADNLPLLGPHRQLDGLWSAEAIWVTHAAGAAAGLVGLMFDEPGTEWLDVLSPDRFAGQSAAELRSRALARYRDIYTDA